MCCFNEQDLVADSGRSQAQHALCCSDIKPCAMSTEPLQLGLWHGGSMRSAASHTASMQHSCCLRSSTSKINQQSVHGDAF